MAGQDVQQLLLQVDATTELMRRELAKAAAETDQWATRTENAVNRASGSFDTMGSAANLAKGAIGGFIASISIGTLVQAGKAVLDFADDLDAAAEKAGLTAERYQTLKEGLRALEVDGEKADNIFQRLQDTLGAVQGGTAAAGVTNALDKMGVTSRILNGEITDTAGLFDAIAGSASKFKTQAEFVSAVVDIVGRKLGVDLATAIKDGGVALTELEGGFKKSGHVITDEYVKRLADANEKLAIFARDTKATLTIWAAETIGFFQSASEAADKFLNRSANPLSSTGGMKAPAWLDFLNAPAIPFQWADAPAPPAPNKVLKSIMGQNGNLKANGLPGFIGDRPKITFPTMKTQALAKVAKSSSPVASLADLRAGGYDNTGKNLPIIPITVTDPAFVALDGIAERLQAIQALTGDLSKAQIIDPEQLKAAKKFSDDLSRGLGQAIIYGQNIGDALVNSIKAAAAELVSSQLLKLLGGDSGTGGLLGFVAKGLGSLFGGGRASGGPVQAGVPYIVGEHREELFIPSTRGRIAPRVPNGGGGGGIQEIVFRHEPSPFFITTVAATSQAAGREAAGEALRGAMRGRMPGSRGA